MVLEHWELEREPFANVPGGSLFYGSPQHEEALNRLLYVVRHRKGVGMLTGEVGCGKTTVTRALAACLSGQPYEVVVLSNPALSPEELLKAILLKLSGRMENGSKAWVLEQIQRHLVSAEAAGRRVVLVIDEAHVISRRETLDELRMLLNLQTEDSFLLTLILLGQPPLLRTISGLQPLRERIALRYNLQPLDFGHTVRYLLYRLQQAGARRGIFTREAAGLIHEASGGIPLRINNLGDRCLLIGCQCGASRVDRRIVQAAVEDMEE
ncbi:MAG: AAA family ATPase [Desulfobacterales bacterium]